MVVKRALVAAGALAVTALVLASVPGTSALWRDSASLDGGTIRSGELSLLNGNATTQVASYAFTELAGTGLAPGGWSQAPLTIRNAGSADLEYRLAGVDVTGSPDLAAALTLTVQGVPATTSCPTGVGAADPAGPVSGVYSGPLVGASTTAARPLTVGAREVLCLRVAVSAGAPPAAQDSTTSVTFTFGAVST